MSVIEERRLPASRSSAPSPSFPRRHAFALALGAVTAFLVLIVQQVLDYGYLVDLDYHVHEFRLDLRYPQLYDPMYYLVMIGQRGPAALVAGAVAGTLAWRLRTWRPVLILAGALLALNLLVGGGKLYTARLNPSEGNAEIFANGIIFPSGHAADVVISWGIIVYLLYTYGLIRRWRLGVTVAALASLMVGVASVYLDTHWVSDILAGWAVGAIILMVTIYLDRRYPVEDRIAAPSFSYTESHRRRSPHVAGEQDRHRVRRGRIGRRRSRARVRS